MSEFLKSNKALDDAIRGASSVEEIREITLAALATSGVVVRNKQDQFDVRVNPQAPEPLASATSLPDNDTRMSKDSETFMRVLYLRGNSRFEIFGRSEQDLDTQEAGLRALYGQPR
jgi:hypothetical protein